MFLNLCVLLKYISKNQRNCEHTLQHFHGSLFLLTLWRMFYQILNWTVSFLNIIWSYCLSLWNPNMILKKEKKKYKSLNLKDLFLLSLKDIFLYGSIKNMAVSVSLSAAALMSWSSSSRFSFWNGLTPITIIILWIYKFYKFC
jgi:hypothetical protein